MLAFILRRLVQSLFVMLAVGVLAFTLFRFVGDPVNQLVGQDTSMEDRERLRQDLGLNDAVPLQFARYLFRAAQLDFGISYQFKQPVTQLLAERFPATFELAIMAMLLALAIGIPMGIYTGLYRNSALSKAFLAGSLVGISLPTFFIGIILIFIFAVQCRGWTAALTAWTGLSFWGGMCLPSFGRGQVVDLGIWNTGLLTASGWQAIILPSITLGLFQMTLVMRLVRAEMLEIMRMDFIKFARARGLKSRAIHFGHALKNTLVPVITITGLQFGSIIAFAIITETVFQWPGMGLLFLRSVQTVDIPIMAAYLMLIGFLFVVINLIVDLLYFAVDPRIRGAVKAAH